MKNNPAAQALQKKFADRSARVGVVGLGYVGLPLALEFVRAGFSVTGVDVSEEKIKKIRSGRSYIEDIPHRAVKDAVDSGLLEVSTGYRALKKVSSVSITVPTPLGKSREPDVSYIQEAVSELGKVLPRGVLVVLESTTYPGTTRELVEAHLIDAGYKIDKDLFVAFSPERVDPGNRQWTTHNTPKVVGGTTPTGTKLAAALYEQAVEHVVSVGSTEEAEMVKLLENTFRAVNIALVNELMLMCDRMGIDIWNVIDAAGTKPFGFMPFFPGPGIGGHCIPLDPTYLAWRAKAYNYTNRFIELATDINGNMPRFVLNKSARILNHEKKKALNGAKILLLGMAYKPGVSDVRESPGVEVYRLLSAEGAKVGYADPHVAGVPASLVGKRLRPVKLTPAALKQYDLAILITHHAEFDYKEIARHAPLILDTRNAFGGIRKKTIHRL